MANRRELVRRRKSVRNIRKITRTMQLIATARFQAAFNRAMATKPYTQKLAELVADLSRAAGDVDHPLLATHDEVKRSALVVLTSARGLAGGYNAHVLRAAVTHLDAQAAGGIETRVHMIGKKGIAYFRFLRRPMAEQIPTFGERPKFEQVEPIANALIDAFLEGEIASAYVAYMRFVSAGQQRPEVLRLLPLTAPADGAAPAPGAAPAAGGAAPAPAAGAGAGDAGAPDAAAAARPRTVDYELSPSPRELLDELLPAIIRARLFQAFNDALVSEQVARMVAMKAATDAAGDMIKALSRQYNRARQTQITMELLDIVGGSNALS
ncbi:MAG TPA: ATP synthase F1 subunit gamma [Thermoanaerobaculia bacterium]|jgi:F-type H+-transporting ATPase subunit gamma|nr:ATP synthase F1 subunit gamma [Thermoanaerobaculia bacterium]